MRVSPPFARARIEAPQKNGKPDRIRTVCELIDFNARANPHRTFALQASPDPAGKIDYEYREISHAELRLAVRRCQAHLLREVAGIRQATMRPDGTQMKRPPVALLMLSEIELLVYKLGLLGLGVPVALFSARLSPAAISHLLLSLKPCAIFVSSQLNKLAAAALALSSSLMTTPILRTPRSVEVFLNATDGIDGVSPSICHKNHYLGGSDTNVLILHSSGTTGYPKPIYVSHDQLLSFTTCHELGDQDTEGINVSTLPLFHGFGLVAPFLSLGVGLTLCIPPASARTGSSTISLLKSVGARSLMTVPSILDEIVTFPGSEATALLASLKFVAFGGGLLNPRTGELLTAAGVRLLNHYGTTETGPLAPIFCPSGHYNWEYFRIRRDIDWTMRELPSEAGESTPRFQMSVVPWGAADPFTIQDELVSNPRLPERDFTAIGRRDDLIVMATGEKVVPRIIESALTAHGGSIKNAVAFGQGRFELGVLVQPTFPLSSPAGLAEFRSFVWALVEEVNERVDAHARITSPDAIFIVPFDMELPRSDKGSLMRREICNMLAQKIDEIYDKLDEPDTTGAPTLSESSLERDLKGLIQSTPGWHIAAEEWDFDDNLFELGLDSLQALRLQRHVSHFLSSNRDESSDPPSAAQIREMIYENPSVSALARAIETARVGGGGGGPTASSMVDEFAARFAVPRATAAAAAAATTTTAATVEGRPWTALVTGGTGSLGCHLVASLAASPRFARVICLGRASRSRRPHGETERGLGRQMAALEARKIGLSDAERAKLVVYEADASLAHLGLREDDYRRLCRQVTHVVHAAWPMSFHWGLASFETQFRVLRNLLTFCLEAHETQRERGGAGPPCRIRFLFTSSISVVGNYPKVFGGRVVPEVNVGECDGKDSSLLLGYAKAKLVCEKIVQRAQKIHGDKLDAATVRLGQIAGSKTTAMWNTDEHLAAMIKSSQLIGQLPNILGTLSWLPVETMAATLVDILMVEERSDGHRIYHVENPVRQSWHDVLSIVAESLGMQSKQFLNFDVWLDKVVGAADPPCDGDLDANPARKLADFFREDFLHMASGGIVLATDASRRCSPSLSMADAIDGDTLRAFCRKWREVGFLS